MTPDATGRHCNNCQKSVIDFTVKTDEEIQQFFIENINQPVCGRFKNTQVQRIVIDLPQNIFSIKMPLWMRFLVACLLIFGVSIFPFETTIAGKTATELSFYQGEPIKTKTADKKLHSKKRKKKTIICITYTPDMISGMISMNPIPDILLDTAPVNDTGLKLTKEVSYAVNKDKSTHLSTTSKLPHKEQPGPTPFMPTEFILPSILLFKKENNNQTMD